MEITTTKRRRRRAVTAARQTPSVIAGINAPTWRSARGRPRYTGASCRAFAREMGLYRHHVANLVESRPLVRRRPVMNARRVPCMFPQQPRSSCRCRPAEQRRRTLAAGVHCSTQNVLPDPEMVVVPVPPSEWRRQKLARVRVPRPRASCADSRYTVSAMYRKGNHSTSRECPRVVVTCGGHVQATYTPCATSVQNPAPLAAQPPFTMVNNAEFHILKVTIHTNQVPI